MKKPEVSLWRRPQPQPENLVSGPIREIGVLWINAGLNCDGDTFTTCFWLTKMGHWALLRMRNPGLPTRPLDSSRQAFRVTISRLARL